MKQITTNNEKTMRHTEKMNNETHDRSYKKNVYFWNIEWDLNELNVFSGKLRCCKKNTDRVISLYLVVFLTIEQIFLLVVFQIKNISICTRTKLKPLKKLTVLDG